MDLIVLWRFREGDLPEDQRRVTERHVASCEACRSALAQTDGDGRLAGDFPGSAEPQLGLDLLRTKRLLTFAESLPTPPAASKRPFLSPLLRKPAALAASLLLAVGIAGGGFYGFGERSPSWKPDTGQGVVWEFSSVSGKGEGAYQAVPEGDTIRSDAREPVFLRFAGGSRVRLEPDSEGEWNALKGDGFRFQLSRGEVHAEIASGNSGFEVQTSAGTVRVLGTRFSVRLVEIPSLSPFFSPLPLGERGRGEGSSQGMVVDLQEGKVQLEGDSGAKVLSGRQRGFVLSGMDPYPMEKGTETGREEDLRSVWSHLLKAYQTGQQKEFSFFLMVLACQGDSLHSFLEQKTATSKEEKECLRIVRQALKDSTSEDGR